MQTATVTVLTLLLAAATVSLAHHLESHEGSQPVVGNAAVVEASPVSSPASAQIVSSSGHPVVDQSLPAHQFGPHGSIGGEQHHHHQHVGPHDHHHHQDHHHQAPSYYAPAGVIQVVGEQGGQNKPAPVAAGAVRQQQAQYASAEQYGQPEAGSLPPNYKPFGSWGLYIGGNPADGYYSNYYKALSNSVQEKPVSPVGVVGSQEVNKPVVSPASALSPVLRQASSSPYIGADYYPFAYSTSDLNTGVVSPSAAHVIPQGAQSGAPHYAAISPVQAGAQVYGSQSGSFEPAVFAYADSDATKRVGQSAVQQQQVVSGIKEPQYQYQREVQVPVQQFVQQPAQQVKGYHYAYPSQYSSGQQIVYASPAVSSPVVAGHQQQHQQSPHVVAYPVPVGSQIVGSQQGVDGAFQPYGVHAFTRYAVKPTAVHSDQSYYYQFPSYKQFSSSSAPSQQVAHSAPLSYYGYPLSQLHYSQSSVAGPHKVVDSAPVPVGAVDVAPVIAEASEEKAQKKAAN